MPRRRRRKNTAVGGLALVGQAIETLRAAPVAAFAAYYVGAIVFVLAFLFFWSDMSRSAFAAEHCAAASLAMAAAFVWLKVWQCAFAGIVWRYVTDEPSPAWTVRRVARMVCLQTALGATGLLVIPLAMLLAFPFGHTLAFYQNLSVAGDGTDTMRETVARAWREARRWPRQNHVVIWLASPWMLGTAMFVCFSCAWLLMALSPVSLPFQDLLGFVLAVSLMGSLVLLFAPLGYVVAINVSVLLIVLPAVLRSLFGIATPFSVGGVYAVTNTTFLMTVFWICFLCLDPIVKTTYVLRCFYGESLRSGRDLLVELRRVVGRTVLVALLACGSLAAIPASGAESDAPLLTPPAAEPTQRLDDSIREVVRERRYTWRMPRERRPAPDDFEGPGWLRRLLERLFEGLRRVIETIGRALEEFFDWLEKLLQGERIPSRGISLSWQEWIRVLLFTSLAAAASVLGIGLYRLWKRRKTFRAQPVAVPAAVDLEDEATAADELPPNQWFSMAEDLRSQGDYRLALRAAFLGELAELARLGRLTIVKHKSNRDYIRELQRRAHDIPDVCSAFGSAVRLIEETWYGTHTADEAMFARFQQYHHAIVGT